MNRLRGPMAIVITARPRLRNIVLMAIPTVLLWVLLVNVTAEAPDLTGLGWLFLSVTLLFQTTVQAIANACSMAAGARARRAWVREEARKRQVRRDRDRRYASLVNGEWRTGHQPTAFQTIPQ